MRLLGLDFETTGLNTAEDRIVEVGLTLWCTERRRPLVVYSQFLYDEGISSRLTPETCEMMKRICGIEPEMLAEFGMDPRRQLAWLESFCKDHKVDYVVAHNGNGYDKPLLTSELKRHGLPDTLVRMPWLDTKCDIPHPTPPDSNKLKHLALEAGFINPFAHRAVFDVLTMLRVLDHYPIEDVVAYSQKPSIIIRAVVPHPKADGGKGKDTAKAAGYRWQDVDYEQFPLCWVKKIKADQLEAERARLPDYQVVVIK